MAYTKFIDLFRKNGFDSLDNSQLKILIVQIIPVNFIKSLDLIATKTLLNYISEEDLKSIIDKSEKDLVKKKKIISSTKDELLKMVFSQDQLIKIDRQIKLLNIQQQQKILNNVPDIQLRSFLNNLTSLRKNELIQNVYNLSKIQLSPILKTIENFSDNQIGIF
jgi:hypothetical protein